MSLASQLFIVLAAQPAGPSYATPETKSVVEAMVARHGGLPAWRSASQVRYRFFTRNVGADEPWLSWESVEPRTGRARIDWPVLGAVTGFDGKDVWTRGWRVPLSPGFFAHLTYSFVTLPFQTQQDGVTLEAVGRGKLPNRPEELLTVRMTMTRPRGTVPGTYYRLFIDPSTHLLRAVEFDIAHPGMVANPDQPLGPNTHIFEEHRTVGGLVLPVSYLTVGRNPRDRVEHLAVHYVFDLSVDRPFDPATAQRPPDATVDSTTNRWWARRATKGAKR